MAMIQLVVSSVSTTGPSSLDSQLTISPRAPSGVSGDKNVAAGARSGGIEDKVLRDPSIYASISVVYVEPHAPNDQLNCNPRSTSCSHPSFSSFVIIEDTKRKVCRSVLPVAHAKNP